MREYAVTQKTKFATNINHTKHSRSASMRAFGCRVSCIGNKRQIPLAPGDSLIQRKRRIQVLVIQWLQAHITLFSKYFASFPHGTCSLSDSRRYLALDEIYHLIYVPIPGNVTLRSRTLRSTAQALNWAVTIRCILFQKTYACRTTSNASRYYNAKQ